jgi:hypothetical protein
MRTLALAFCFVVLSSCKTEPKVAGRDIRHDPESSSSAKPDGAVAVHANADAAAGTMRRLSAGELQRCEQLLSRLEMRLAVSPSDDELTSIVAKEMGRRKERFPEHYKFLIGKRGRHLIVSVIDFEAACRGDRPSATTYHLEKKGGVVRILFEAAEI